MLKFFLYNITRNGDDIYSNEFFKFLYVQFHLKKAKGSIGLVRPVCIKNMSLFPKSSNVKVWACNLTFVWISRFFDQMRSNSKITMLPSCSTFKLSRETCVTRFIKNVAYSDLCWPDHDLHPSLVCEIHSSSPFPWRSKACMESFSPKLLILRSQRP